MKPDQWNGHVAQRAADRYSNHKGDHQAIEGIRVQRSQGFDVTLLNPGQHIRIEHKFVTRKEQCSGQNTDRKHQGAQ